MAKLTDKEKKYLAEKLELIRAVIMGSLWGAYMFPPKDGQFGEPARYQTDMAMKRIEKDILNIIRHLRK